MTERQQKQTFFFLGFTAGILAGAFWMLYLLSWLGFATIGDNDLTIFDITGMDKIYAALERGGSDFVPTAQKLGLVAIETLYFPQPVESTAG